MASKALALNSPELLAEYVRESELTGFFEKRFASPPDHMAMLIRNGEIIDTYKGAHFSIGGVLKSIKSLVVGSSHVSILLADLKPFSIQTELKAITNDNVPVAALGTIELQVNPDEPKNVMGLVNASGYLTRDEVLARFKPHLTDRVIESAIKRVNANELRGERGLQDHIQAEIMREVERVAGDLGLIVRAVSLEWAINEVERQAMEKSVLDREQGKLDNELEYLKQNVTRNNDAKSFKIETDLDFAKLQNATEEELEHLILNREVRILDARVDVQRRQELESLAHEIEVLRNERLGKFENRLAEADHQVDAAKRQLGLARVHQEIDLLNQTHLAEMKKLNAFTDLEIHKRTQFLDLEVSKQAQTQQAAHLLALQGLEQAGEDAEMNRRIRAKQADGQIANDQVKAKEDARLAQLREGAKMTPEQILAINAGHSADVAAVLTEQARASGNGSEQVNALMQEMVKQANDARTSADSQAREMFRMGMEGATGVAQGAGGGRVETSIGGASSSTLECSNCGRENAVKNRCCIGCGKQLRN